MPGRWDRNLCISPQGLSSSFSNPLRPYSPDSFRFLGPDAAGPSWRLRTKVHLETRLQAHCPGYAMHSHRHTFAQAIHFAHGTSLPHSAPLRAPYPEPRAPLGSALAAPAAAPTNLGFQHPRPCPRRAPILQRPLTSAACAPSLAPAPLPWHAPASPPALRQGDSRSTPPPAPPQAPGWAVAASSLPPPRPHFRASTIAELKSAAAAALGSAR